MNTNSASKKVISMVCLIAGIILLAVALIQDISGSGAGWRGPALIIGAIGNVFIPDITPSQPYCYLSFCISVLIYLCGNRNHSVMSWCILFLYRLEWNQNERICRTFKL